MSKEKTISRNTLGIGNLIFYNKEVFFHHTSLKRNQNSIEVPNNIFPKVRPILFARTKKLAVDLVNCVGYPEIQTFFSSSFCNESTSLFEGMMDVSTILRTLPSHLYIVDTVSLDSYLEEYGYPDNLTEGQISHIVHSSKDTKCNFMTSLAKNGKIPFINAHEASKKLKYGSNPFSFFRPNLVYEPDVKERVYLKKS